MRFERVRLEGLGRALADEITTSEQLEARLEASYARLGLSPGRLELMSGIRERRFFPKGTRPSAIATAAAEDVLQRTGFDRSRIGLLIHASVCRDFLEPATASVVHGALGLSPACMAYDLSNACLGVANGMVVAAQALEAGTIDAALIVSGEDGRDLIDETIAHVNAIQDGRVLRKALKQAYASLTIGGGGAAVLLTREGIGTSNHRLLGATARAATEHVGLCEGDTKGTSGPLMETDSEALLQAGNALAASTFAAFLNEQEWTRDSIDHVITHQVGAAHKKLLFSTLELDPAKDHPTVQFLGNVGSASLPLTLDHAATQDGLDADSTIAMLGIGSGLHSLMLHLTW
tara:strand:+ start:3060 stop:4100 length:1041 start_codon:yes stop_codon:yes gene_type:complete